MKIFQCGYCDHPLYFESNHCENCGHLAGYRDSDRKMLTFDPNGLKLISDREKLEYTYCKNKEYGVCNWLVVKDDAQVFCKACQLNRTIPNLSEKKNFEKWKKLEIAKHRLVYQLQKIGLQLFSKINNSNGLCFDFVAKQNNPKTMTGHASGVITILLREADSVLREQMRKQLMEPYRTLIGHLRHEVGHYFWDQLVVTDESILTDFRLVFGDDRENYSDALKNYYKVGAPSNWLTSYISKYASAHAWEDWAETWAHYLHIMDMVETAHFFNLHVSPQNLEKDMKIDVSFDPYTMQDFDKIIDACVPLTFAVNSINRSMGIPDVYPFKISPTVVYKMKFVHRLLLSKR